MANEKIYKITVNGITESIDAVKSLEKELFNLEQKIKELESRTVNVRTTGTAGTGGGGSSRTSNVSTLNEEEAAQREINKQKQQGLQLDAKIIAAQDESYKRLDATKELYKSVIADQKSVAAQERLIANEYTTTMQGMKQHLADIKSVINTTDLGDSDKIKDMTKEANELTNKLKEMEEAYGQFGRNVGNYPDAAKSMQAIVVTINGVERQFDSAREATKTLNNELKAMAVNGKQNTKEYEELRQKLLELESTMNDAKKPMDGLMDTMESITAIASVSKGLGAFFGVDSTEIQRSMQQLLALQTALKGLQTISKQIDTREGVGKWIAPFTKNIDKATHKLLVFNRALLGTGTAGKAAAKGIKLASTALKTLMSIGIVAVISIAIEKVMDLIESFNKLSDVEEAQKNVEEEMGKAYGEATAKLIQYKGKLEDFNGTKKQEKKLVEELNKEFGTTLGTYKSVAEWQDVMKKKGEAYIKTLTLQAKAQALVNELTAAYGKLAQIDFKKTNGEYDKLWNRWFGKSYEAEKVEINNLISFITSSLESVDKEIEQHNKDNKLGNYAPQIEKNTDKTKKALEEQQRTLNQLQVRLMADGLNKKLRQLDEEERQTIQKIKENGRKTADVIKQIQSSYATLRMKEINEYLKNLETTIKQSAQNIASVDFEINDTKLKNQIAGLQSTFEQLSNDQPIRNTYKSYSETKEIKKFYKVDDSKIEFARNYENLFRTSEATKKADEYYKFLLNYVKDKDKELFQDIADYNEAIYKETDEDRKTVYMQGLENTFKKVEAMVEQEYSNELLYVRNYTQQVDQTLTESFKFRIKAEENYDKTYRQELMKNIQEQSKLNNVLINNASDAASEAEEKRYQAVQLPLKKQKDALEETIKNFKARNNAEVKSLEELKDKLKTIEDQMEQQRQQHYTKLVQITDDTNNKLKKNEIDTANQISTEQQKTFDNQIANLRDAQSKINELMSKQPVYNKLGTVNIAKTKEQYKEIENAAKDMIQEIIAQQALLNIAFNKGLIKPEAMNAIRSQLNDLLTEFKKMFASITEETNNTIPKFIESIQVYLQAAMDSFNTIMNAVWDAQDTQMDKEAEALDKANEILEKKLDEQQEIVEQHKSKIDSIEDELATARGDRRQHLIDQLNAEMRAQREAAAQEKKLQKQKEANERKQDDLERKRKEQQYDRDMLQAVVNGAMAVTYALANKWPIPAIPLAALAASTTAAQIAIMAANKPYAKGGLLEGPSHAQGGIPIPGTGIEVEGKEYVIRKKSTSPNIDILDYINKSERKLNLDDFIQFYSSGNIKKTISSMSPRSKFADGGVVPTLNTNIDINDRLLTAFDAYSNRPVVVSVQDINTRQKAVRNVQVLAGLE